MPSHQEKFPTYVQVDKIEAKCTGGRKDRFLVSLLLTKDQLQALQWLANQKVSYKGHWSGQYYSFLKFLHDEIETVLNPKSPSK